MKAIQVKSHGGPDSLEYTDVPDPIPGENQVLVRNETIGVNFIDIYHRTGLYPASLPLIPGIEAAGRVEEVGAKVTGFLPGDRVIYTLSLGSYAEYSAVDAWKTVPLPEDVTLESGVTAMCQGMTAHYLVTDCFQLREGHSALVHAAAGGVGLLLVQMAKQKGARVFGTVSTEEKAELALAAGADHVILYSQEDFELRIRDLTGGQGVDVVYESVGKDTFEKSLNSLSRRGYMVLYGQSSGPVEPLDPQVLNKKGSLFLTRPSLFDYASNGEEFSRRAGDVLAMMQKHSLSVRVGERLPLADAQTAHRNLEARKTTGKILLTP